MNRTEKNFAVTKLDSDICMNVTLDANRHRQHSCNYIDLHLDEVVNMIKLNILVINKNIDLLEQLSDNKIW